MSHWFYKVVGLVLRLLDCMRLGMYGYNLSAAAAAVSGMISRRRQQCTRSMGVQLSRINNVIFFQSMGWPSFYSKTNTALVYSVV